MVSTPDQEANMIAPATAPPLTAELVAGRPPMLIVDTPSDAARRASAHREVLRALVGAHGSILVRGLGLADAVQVGAVFHQLGTPMSEREAFAPREERAPGVHTSTRWPINQPMCMHHELSYTLEFPGLMLFACLVAPLAGGATLVADSAAVLRTLPFPLLDRFERVGWMLVRNYNDDIGASVAASFGTDDRAAVERYCLEHSIRFEWLPEGTLRTWQRRDAVMRHPVSGQRCWFNQAAFLSEWTMDPEVRDYLVEIYGEEGLPFRTLYGDGGTIGPEVVQAINAAYDEHTLRESWQAGDLLLVDN